MAESGGQERTEQPTPKRLRDARNKGQIARSRELTTTLVLLGSGAGLFMMGGHFIGGMANIMQKGFSFTRKDIYNDLSSISLMEQAIADALVTFTPFVILVVFIAIIAPTLLGGFSFSPQSIAFKMEKMDPIKGLKRVFGPKGLMELAKALAKFLVIASIASLILWTSMESFIGLGSEPVEKAMAHAMNLLAWALLAISSGMIIIALVDVPFQLWDHAQQLRMTKQEVKDEYKQTEGSPEVKGHIRRMQREMSERRMMAEVPHADVVITNPTHYAVALKYDQATMTAPVVLAKGVDFVAGHIRDIARANDVPIVESPALARAVYHTTDLDKPIPEGLYLAVAQILAYVFQLKRNTGNGAKNDNLSMPDVSIPDDMQYD